MNEHLGQAWAWGQAAILSLGCLTHRTVGTVVVGRVLSSSWACSEAETGHTASALQQEAVAECDSTAFPLRVGVPPPCLIPLTGSVGTE